MAAIAGSDSFAAAPYMTTGDTIVPLANDSLTMEPGDPVEISTLIRSAWWRFKTVAEEWVRFDASATLGVDTSLYLNVSVWWIDPYGVWNRRGWWVSNLDNNSPIVQWKAGANATYFIRIAVDDRAGASSVTYQGGVGTGTPPNDFYTTQKPGPDGAETFTPEPPIITDGESALGQVAAGDPPDDYSTYVNEFNGFTPIKVIYWTFQPQRTAMYQLIPGGDSAVAIDVIDPMTGRQLESERLWSSTISAKMIFTEGVKYLIRITVQDFGSGFGTELYVSLPADVEMVWCGASNFSTYGAGNGNLSAGAGEVFPKYIGGPDVKNIGFDLAQAIPPIGAVDDVIAEIRWRIDMHHVGPPSLGDLDFDEFYGPSLWADRSSGSKAPLKTAMNLRDRGGETWRRSMSVLWYMSRGQVEAGVIYTGTPPFNAPTVDLNQCKLYWGDGVNVDGDSVVFDLDNIGLEVYYFMDNFLADPPDAVRSITGIPKITRRRFIRPV